MKENTLNSSNHDTCKEIKDKNRKLMNMVRKLKKEIKEVRSENKTLKKAWNKTEKWLEESHKLDNI